MTNRRRVWTIIGLCVGIAALVLAGLLWPKAIGWLTVGAVGAGAAQAKRRSQVKAGRRTHARETERAEDAVNAARESEADAREWAVERHEEASGGGRVDV